MCVQQSYAHIFAYAMDLFTHEPVAAVSLSIVLITVNINIRQIMRMTSKYSCCTISTSIVNLLMCLLTLSRRAKSEITNSYFWWIQTEASLIEDQLVQCFLMFKIRILFQAHINDFFFDRHITKTFSTEAMIHFVLYFKPVYDRLLTAAL